MAVRDDGRVVRDQRRSALDEAISRGYSTPASSDGYQTTAQSAQTGTGSSRVSKYLARTIILGIIVYLAMIFFNKIGHRSNDSDKIVSYNIGAHFFTLGPREKSNWIKFPDQGISYSLTPKTSNYSIIFSDGTEYRGDVRPPDKPGHPLMRICATNYPPQTITLKISLLRNHKKKAKKARKAVKKEATPVSAEAPATAEPGESTDTPAANEGSQ